MQEAKVLKVISPYFVKVKFKKNGREDTMSIREVAWKPTDKLAADEERDEEQHADILDNQLGEQIENGHQRKKYPPKHLEDYVTNFWLKGKM